MARRSKKQRAYEADMASAQNSELLLQLADIYRSGANPELNSRRVLPRPDVNDPDALARHRVAANEAGSRAQWFMLPGEAEPHLRLVGHTAGGGLSVGDFLSSRHNLASAGPDSERKRFAVDLNRLRPLFNADMTENQIHGRAQDKYAYINHRGGAAHHILPVSFLARVKQGLAEYGIEGPFIDELIVRKMAQGDHAANLAHAIPNPGEKAKGAEGLEQVIAPYDEHKMIHDTAEAKLKNVKILKPGVNSDEIKVDEIIDLLDVNYAPNNKKAGWTRAVNENDVSTFMNSDATPLQKQAFGMAVAQAHRQGLQEVKLPLSDKSSDARKLRHLKEESLLHSDVMKATTEFSPLTQHILSGMYGTTPATVDVAESLRTFNRG